MGFEGGAVGGGVLIPLVMDDNIPLINSSNNRRILLLPLPPINQYITLLPLLWQPCQVTIDCLRGLIRHRVVGNEHLEVGEPVGWGCTLHWPVGHVMLHVESGMMVIAAVFSTAPKGDIIDVVIIHSGQLPGLIFRVALEAHGSLVIPGCRGIGVSWASDGLPATPLSTAIMRCESRFHFY